MLRRRFLLALPLLAAALASPAAAGEGPPKQVGQYVDLQPMMLPVIVDGRLENYVYVSVRLNLTASADPSRWRTKEPLFRDALVRLGHHTSFTLPGDYDKLDAARLSAAMAREAMAITGPGVIRSVVVTAQSPSRHVRRPPA
jgi:hypothetical protein